MTLAAIISIAAALAAFGLGMWLIVAGSVALALGDYEPLRAAIGEPLFIRCAVTAILVGTILFLAGASASARLIV